MRKRNTRTLEQILLKHLRPNGMSIHTDGWSAYLNFNWLRLNRIHHRHIHTDRIGQERTLLHSNLIEGLWGNMQRKLKLVYGKVPGGEADVRGFIYEALWRLELEAQPLQHQNEFIT